MPAEPHQHNETDTFYVDQLCLIGISGAFAAICLTLYFVRLNMLRAMFGPPEQTWFNFNNYILWSGIVLLILVVLRAVAVWRSVGNPALRDLHANHDHGYAHHPHMHPHEHHHDHAHGNCGHDHGHIHQTASVVAPSPHDHDHGHTHDGADDDHDHGWAPWRYAVLLVPIALYMLGLPNQLRALKSVDEGDTTQFAANYASTVALGPNPLLQLVRLEATTCSQSSEVFGVDFKTLEALALDETRRNNWMGKMVQVVGQFAPNPRSAQFFSLARYRIQCCAADAVQLNVPIFSAEPITNFEIDQWVQVTARVEFRQRGGRWNTVLLVDSKSQVKPAPPEPDLYIR